VADATAFGIGYERLSYLLSCKGSRAGPTTRRRLIEDVRSAESRRKSARPLRLGWDCARRRWRAFSARRRTGVAPPAPPRGVMRARAGGRVTSHPLMRDAADLMTRERLFKRSRRSAVASWSSWRSAAGTKRSARGGEPPPGGGSPSPSRALATFWSRSRHGGSPRSTKWLVDRRDEILGPAPQRRAGAGIDGDSQRLQAAPPGEPRAFRPKRAGPKGRTRSTGRDDCAPRDLAGEGRGPSLLLPGACTS